MHFWFESCHMNLGRAILAYQFVEHEFGRIDVWDVGPMIEHGKDNAPCRDSFQFITYMAYQ